MTTVNSLSGGKTSSYIAMHYPADVDIFALVCIDDHNAAGKMKGVDSGIRRIVTDRLMETCPQYGEFVATAEDPKTLKVVLDLEQKIGRRITWVRGDSFEEVMNKQKAVPNVMKRFCSYWLKVVPIFTYLYMHDLLPCRMRIGYRYDEKERVNDFKEEIEFSLHCDLFGRYARNHRWTTIHWREGEFPLVEDRVFHFMIKAFWNSQHPDVIFPPDSNCQICLHKSKEQIRKNYDTNPGIIMWGAVQEILRGHTFKTEMSLLDITRLGLQVEMEFDSGPGCQGGFCTD